MSSNKPHKKKLMPSGPASGIGSNPRQLNLRDVRSSEKRNTRKFEATNCLVWSKMYKSREKTEGNPRPHK